MNLGVIIVVSTIDSIPDLGMSSQHLFRGSLLRSRFVLRTLVSPVVDGQP